MAKNNGHTFCMLDVNKICSLKSQRQSLYRSIFCVNPSISSELWALFSLFLLCLYLSLWVFSSASHFNQLDSRSYVTNIAHTRMEIIQKNDAFMQKKFTGLLPVCCACVYVSLNWPFEMKWKETDIIIAKFFGSFHM